jgi:hypothetical protein
MEDSIAKSHFETRGQRLYTTSAEPIPSCFKWSVAACRFRPADGLDLAQLSQSRPARNQHENNDQHDCQGDTKKVQPGLTRCHCIKTRRAYI